jgi:hypothetical protein
MSGQFEITGETKLFFDQPGTDMTLAMILALGSEISALSDRLETVIDLLGVTGMDEFTPNEAQQARRDAARKMLIETLLAPFQQMADGLAAQASKK